MKDLFEKARNEDVSILADPDIIKANQRGWTPLHELAARGKREVLSHSEVASLKDIFGRTPLILLAWHGNICYSDFKKFFPWYNGQFHKGNTMHNLFFEVCEISKFSQSIQYILED